MKKPFAFYGLYENISALSGFMPLICRDTRLRESVSGLSVQHLYRLIPRYSKQGNPYNAKVKYKTIFAFYCGVVSLTNVKK